MVAIVVEVGIQLVHIDQVLKVQKLVAVVVVQLVLQLVLLVLVALELQVQDHYVTQLQFFGMLHRQRLFSFS